MVQINESNMIFGEFKENKIFEIEKSKLHNKIGNGIMVITYIRCIKKEVVISEYYMEK